LNDSLDTGRLQEALVEARRLINHTDRDVREQVAYALDWIGIDALPELSSMMTDGDTTVAEIAASAFWENLYDLEDPEFKGELLSLLLQSPVVAIQKRAVDEIGFLPPTQSIPLILGKVPSADPELYLTIQNNLYFLSGGEEFRTLDEWESWYQNNKEVFENE
jgi:HEAT repeat protein